MVSGGCSLTAVIEPMALCTPCCSLCIANRSSTEETVPGLATGGAGLGATAELRRSSSASTARARAGSGRAASTALSAPLSTVAIRCCLPSTGGGGGWVGGCCRGCRGPPGPPGLEGVPEVALYAWAQLWLEVQLRRPLVRLQQQRVLQ